MTLAPNEPDSRPFDRAEKYHEHNPEGYGEGSDWNPDALQ